MLGTPTLPTSPVKIYLDVEGDPDEGYIYLIGVLVCDGESEQSYSFWADSKDHETVILQQFLQVLAPYDDVPYLLLWRLTTRRSAEDEAK